MKIEIKHKGSCLGATGGSGRLDRPRHPRERLIVTTHLSFGEWSAVFGDAKMGFISDIV
jgi:hypothetical protein